MVEGEAGRSGRQWTIIFVVGRGSSQADHGRLPGGEKHIGVRVGLCKVERRRWHLKMAQPISRSKKSELLY